MIRLEDIDFRGSREKIPVSAIDLTGLEGEFLDRLLMLLGKLATLNTADVSNVVRAKPSFVTAAAYTLQATDAVLQVNFAGVVTITLPDPTVDPGRMVLVRTITANAVNSASANVVPIIGGAAGAGILVATAGKWALLIANGAVWEIFAAN